MANSISTGTATSGDVCLMVDTAAMDIKSTGTTASASLGIDDGEVSGTCTLPKLTEEIGQDQGVKFRTTCFKRTSVLYYATPFALCIASSLLNDDSITRFMYIFI